MTSTAPVAEARVPGLAEATPGAPADPAAPAATQGARVPVRTMALTLWAVVGSLLVYGVSQTVIKAAALFG